MWVFSSKKAECPVAHEVWRQGSAAGLRQREYVMEALKVPHLFEDLIHLPVPVDPARGMSLEKIPFQSLCIYSFRDRRCQYQGLNSL